MQKATPSVELTNNELPQTQCQKCGFERYKSYAQAILYGEPLNQCPPGGDQVLKAIANIMDQKPVSLNPSHGVLRQERLLLSRTNLRVVILAWNLVLLTVSK